MFGMINYLIKSKYICTLLLIPFIIMVLTSCVQTNPVAIPDKAHPVSINFWHHYVGQQKVLFDNLVSEFNETVGKQNGITIKAYSMDNTGDIHNKLLSSVTGEPGSPDFPEMATAYPGTAYTLYRMNKLISIDKYMSKAELGKYVNSFMEEGRLSSESGIVIFPIAKSTEALYINYTFYKQFLDDYNSSKPAKLLDESMLSTFEGIRETAEAYYNWTDSKTPDKANDGKALFGFDAVSNFSVISFKQLSSEFFKPAGKSREIDLDNAIMKSVWDEYYVPMVKGYYGAYSFYRSEDVQTGDLIMFAGSTAGAGFFPKEVTTADNIKYAIELKALPYPICKSGKKSAVQQGAGVIISKSEPEKEYASVLFLKWLTEPERNVDFVLGTGYLPVTREAIEKTLPQKLLAVGNNPDYINMAKVLKVALDMIKSHELYTYKPFDKSDELRYSFEDKLLSFTQNARESFSKRLSEGHDVSACVKEATSIHVYEQFKSEVRNEILKIK